MKILLYDIDFNTQISLSIGEYLSIECESQKYFSQLIANCKDILEDHIAIIDENDKVINFGKDVLTLIDFYSIEQLSKTALGKLYKQLDVIYKDEDHFQYLTKIEKAVDDLLKSIDQYNMDFEYEIPSTISSYLKLCDVKLKNYSSSVYEDIINLSSLLGATKTYKAIVLVNAKSFFLEKELEEIIKSFLNYNQRIILIDNIITDKKMVNQKKLVIDADLYDILY